MTRFRSTICALALSMTLASPVLAGNIVVGRSAVGNIPVARTGNIATTRTGNIPVARTGNIAITRGSQTEQTQISDGIFALIRFMFESGILL